MSWSVLIVDDHAGFRRYARRLLETSGLTVVGEACDGTTVQDAVDSLQPDIVLLDIMLSDTDGFTVAERLAQNPDPPIVVLTSSRDAADFGSRLDHSRANGFIHKDDLSGQALVAHVRER